MKSNTKITLITIALAAFVIILTGLVFGYMSTSTWPKNEIDQSGVIHNANMQIVAERISKKQLAIYTAQIYTNESLGITFKYPQGWSVTPEIIDGNKVLILKDVSGVAVVVKIYANPKMRKTLPEYLENKLNLKEGVDYRNMTSAVVGGKDAYKIDMLQGNQTVVAHPEVWVKASDKIWLAVGNDGAPLVVIDSILSTIVFAGDK